MFVSGYRIYILVLFVCVVGIVAYLFYPEFSVVKSFMSDDNVVKKVDREAFAKSSAKEKASQLHSAVSSGNLALARDLLELGVNPDVRTNTHSAMGWVVRPNTDIRMAKLLIEYGADVNPGSWEKRGCYLSDAINWKRVDLVKLFLNNGAKPDCVDESTGESALYKAIFRKQYQAADLLLRHGANPNLDSKYNPRYHIKSVIRDNKIVILELMIKNGLDLKPGWNHDSPLHTAVYFNRKEMVALLLKNGAPISSRLKNFEVNELAYAVKLGRHDIVTLITEHVDAGSSKQEDLVGALDRAIHRGDLGIVRQLVAQGADLEKGQYGYPPMETAIGAYQPKIVKFLVESGANVNGKTRDGNPYLHLVAGLPQLETVRFLLDREVDINTLDKYGRTALFLPTSRGHVEMVRFLLDQGADPHVRDWRQETVLDITPMKRAAEMHALFSERGLN